MTLLPSHQSIERACRPLSGGRSRKEKRQSLSVVTRVVCAAALLAGCQNPAVKMTAPPVQEYAPVALCSGDVVKLSFAGMPEFNQIQKVRADGRISLPLIGEYNANGRTPTAIQQELSAAYQKQLQNSNVMVTLENTSATAYVTGAVAKPSKIVIDRPMTVFEAILEAGGFQQDFANPKKVLVLRNENGVQSSRVVDLSPAFKGKPFTSFYVKPHDVIYVPQSVF